MPYVDQVRDEPSFTFETEAHKVHRVKYLEFKITWKKT